MFRTIALASGFAALAAAQSAVLTFTNVPIPITNGQAEALTYATNDTSSPVTIILRKGAATDLKTVATLSTSVTGGQFIYTPQCLPNGNDYALQISQGTQVNYFGPFPVQGYDAGACASSSPSATASATLYSSLTVAANGTASTTVPIAPVTTVGTLSAGTGTALARNTTFSIATLTNPSTASNTASGPSSNTADATASSSGAGFQSSASASPSTANSGSSAISVNRLVSLMLGMAVTASCLL